MSLDDKFFPEDGTKITRLDNTLIKAAGKVGEAYQIVTGRSYKDLCTASMILATGIGAAGAILCPTNFFAYGAIYLHSSMHKCTSYETPIEERMTYEALGQSARTGPLIRLKWAIALPAALAVLGKSTSWSMKQHPEAYKATDSFAPLSYGLLVASCYPTAFAQYLSKANIPKPPKKHIFARAWDKTKESLSGQPALPDPLPISYISEFGQ